MFKVGDRVRIRKSSNFYRPGDPLNPQDTDGIVVSVFENIANFKYFVTWSSDVQEVAYREEDLEYSQTYLNEQRIKKELGIE